MARAICSVFNLVKGIILLSLISLGWNTYYENNILFTGIIEMSTHLINSSVHRLFSKTISTD